MPGFTRAAFASILPDRHDLDPEHQFLALAAGFDLAWRGAALVRRRSSPRGDRLVGPGIHDDARIGAYLSCPARSGAERRSVFSRRSTRVSSLPPAAALRQLHQAVEPRPSIGA